MKQFYAFIRTGILLLFINTTAFSQNNVEALKATVIVPYSLTITFYKTTNLIFPYAIKSVDRGSRDILAQKAGGVENILLVKAGKEHFHETNLSVITTDGALYSFVLNYSPNPPLLNLSFTKDTAYTTTNWQTLPSNNEAQIEVTARRVAKAKPMLHGIKSKRHGMRMGLQGLYISNSTFYFHLEVQNRSNIPYDIEMLRFFIRDDRKAKRTASQEIELPPVYTYGDTTVIRAQATNILVIAMPKFTIPNKKSLFIQLMEKGGGRHPRLDIHNRTIVKAEPLN